MLSARIPIEDEPLSALSSHRLISASDVRNLFGGVSDMTIWRWLNDEALEFPRPIYVQRRRFWRETEITSWIDARGEQVAGS